MKVLGPVISNWTKLQNGGVIVVRQRLCPKGRRIQPHQIHASSTNALAPSQQKLFLLHRNLCRCFVFCDSCRLRSSCIIILGHGQAPLVLGPIWYAHAHAYMHTRTCTRCVSHTLTRTRTTHTPSLSLSPPLCGPHTNTHLV